MNAVTCHASVCRWATRAWRRCRRWPRARLGRGARHRRRYRSWLIHTRVAATAGSPHSPSVIRTEPPVASNSGTLISEAITAPVARLVR